MTFNKRIAAGLLALVLFFESFGLAGAQAQDMKQYKAEAGFLASRQGNYLQDTGIYQDIKNRNIKSDDATRTGGTAAAFAGSPSGGENAKIMEPATPADTVQEQRTGGIENEAVPAAEEAATAIGIPGNINVNAGENTLTVDWDKIDGAQGYEASLNGNISKVLSTSCTFDNLESNTQYFVKVRAFIKDDAGEWSQEKTVYTLLPAPASLTATQSGISVDLAWQPSKDAAGYRIYRNDIEIGYSCTNTYTDIKLEDFDTYTYKVKAVSEAGNVSELSQGCPVIKAAPEQAPGKAVEAVAPEKDDSITPAGIKVPETQNMEVLPAPSDLAAKAGNQQTFI